MRAMDYIELASAGQLGGGGKGPCLELVQASNLSVLEEGQGCRWREMRREKRRDEGGAIWGLTIGHTW